MKLGKAKLSRERARAMEDAVLPLINVVFLLMIFFLVAGRMGQAANDSAAPPSGLSEKGAAATRLLRLLANETLDANGILINDQGLAQEAGTWGNTPVDVQAGAEIPAERVLRLLNTLHSAGVAEVRLLTVRPN